MWAVSYNKSKYSRLTTSELTTGLSLKVYVLWLKINSAMEQMNEVFTSGTWLLHFTQVPNLWTEWETIFNWITSLSDVALMSGSPVVCSWSGAASPPLLSTSSMIRDTPRIAPLASILQRSFRSQRQSYKNMTLHDPDPQWGRGRRKHVFIKQHTCM